MRTAIYIIFLLLLHSCHNRTKDIDVLSNMIGQEISVPENLKFIIDSTFIDSKISDADYTIINYVDSSNCSTCSMKLTSWQKFIENINSHSEGTINI